MSLRRYFKPANKLPTADEQRSIKSLPCHLRSPDGKRKKFIRNWLQNRETQTLNCAIKTGPTVFGASPDAEHQLGKFEKVLNTVEPPNKGHFGNESFVLAIGCPYLREISVIIINNNSRIIRIIPF